MSIREGRATIGVQQPSSDPYIESFDDRGVSELAQEVPLMLERARARWEDAPRHPAHARPASPARRRRSREQGSTQDSTAEEEAAQDQPETPSAAACIGAFCISVWNPGRRPGIGRGGNVRHGSDRFWGLNGGAIPFCRYLGRFRVFGTTRAMQWERRQRPQPASLSLFEWAVGPEEVREEELVGTRR